MILKITFIKLKKKVIEEYIKWNCTHRSKCKIQSLEGLSLSAGILWDFFFISSGEKFTKIPQYTCIIFMTNFLKIKIILTSINLSSNYVPHKCVV